MSLDGETLLARLPAARGRLTPMQSLAALSWFRVGGPAEVLFSPADEVDLARFLGALDPQIPVTVIGVGSNLLVRDGGVRGVVVRLGRGFNHIEALAGARIRAGAAALDARVAQAAVVAGIAGLEFLRGVPGALGGALRMNAGCYGEEVKDVFEIATAVERGGARRELTAAQMGFSYRKSAAPDDLIFTGAVLRGAPDAPGAVNARMAALVAQRESTQPLRERTGGSTFRNPLGRSSTGPADDVRELKAWKVIDEAGCRGLRVGGAIVSEKHCNFLINTGGATAADLENLGEEVRRRVRESQGIALEWEIRRIGDPLDETDARR